MHSSSYFRTFLVGKKIYWKCINPTFYEYQLKWLGFLVMHAFILKSEPLITVKHSCSFSEWAFFFFLIFFAPNHYVVCSCSDSSLHVNWCKIFITVPVWKIYFSTFWMNKECWEKLQILNFLYFLNNLLLLLSWSSLNWTAGCSVYFKRKEQQCVCIGVCVCQQPSTDFTDEPAGWNHTSSASHHW